MQALTTGLPGIALGVAVLLFGKNLRIFAGAAGFFVGVSALNALVPNQPMLTTIVVGVVSAALAVIAITLAKGAVQLVVQIIGALAGAAIAPEVLQSLGLDWGALNWIVVLVGAVAGFMLMARFFNLGIIILTSLIGASLIVSGVQTFIQLDGGIRTVATIALAIIGFFTQRSQR